MLAHAWRILVFVYALGEAFFLADSEAIAGSWWLSALNLTLAVLFAASALWNISQAIRTLLSPRRSTINDAELNDGLSDEDVA